MEANLGAAVRFKNIDGVLLMRRSVRSDKGVFRWGAKTALVCLVVLIVLCNMPESVAETKVGSEHVELKKEAPPVLGDPNYKHDLKYAPIYGNVDGSSFFLHYCLPGFVPQGLGDCDRGSIPGMDPRGVQVEYSYFLRGRDAEQVRMEGSVSYKFPFPVNVDLEGRTPYVNQYKKASERPRLGFLVMAKPQGAMKSKYEGLDLYEVPGKHGGWWVPKELNEYRTKLGNPPIFVCGLDFCYLILDQGNGWVVTAKFNEAALIDWRSFFVQINDSIDLIMEQ